VDVCAVLSLLIHVTELPVANLTGLGEYAAVVNADAPITIDTDAIGVRFSSGVGEAVGTEVDPPQPNEASITRAASGAGVLICFLKARHERRWPPPVGRRPLIRASDHRGRDRGFKKRSARNDREVPQNSPGYSLRFCLRPPPIETAHDR
jgi:hypothetical protein